MGIIGTGLFDDDRAADVRGEYRDLVAEGTLGVEATDILIQENQSALADPEEAPVFWLALAAAQWECGRLEDRVRDEAVAVLNNGTDLALWEYDPKLLSQRRRVLERLRARLASPQPREKQIRKRYKDTCDWEVGEVIAYRLRTGQMVLFRIVGHITYPGTSPICELLDWIGFALPEEGAIKRLSVRQQDWPPDRHTDQFLLVREKADELPIDRVIRVGIKTKASTPRASQGFFGWKDLDQSLALRYPSFMVKLTARANNGSGASSS
jgi:hypothetical protein